MRRPWGVTLICAFCVVATFICATTALALARPGGALEAWWRLKPQARADFRALGGWAIALMVVVGSVTIVLAIGMWRRRPWARWLGVVGFAINGAGDLVTALTRERAAAIGVVVAGLAATYLGAHPAVRRYFRAEA